MTSSRSVRTCWPWIVPATLGELEFIKGKFHNNNCDKNPKNGIFNSEFLFLDEFYLFKSDYLGTSMVCLAPVAVAQLWRV